MSTKKNWTGQEKLSIVLQGLKGNCRISELCNEYGISQGMFYKWRDQLLNDGAKVFARGGVDHEVERLQRENRKLKETIGELTIELKRCAVYPIGWTVFLRLIGVNVLVCRPARGGAKPDRPYSSGGAGRVLRSPLDFV